MTCDEAREMIGPYLEDGLSDETKRRLERHLLGCSACSWEAQSLRVTRDLLRAEAGEVMASDAFRVRAIRRIRADNPHLGPEETTEEPSEYQLPMALF